MAFMGITRGVPRNVARSPAGAVTGFGGAVNVIHMATAFQMWALTPMSGQSFTFSMWINNEQTSGTQTRFWSTAVTAGAPNDGSSNRQRAERAATTDILTVNAWNSVPEVIQRVDSNAAMDVDSMIHVAAAIDCDAQTRQLYINGIESGNSATDEDSTADWRDRLYLFSRPSTAIPYIGKMAEFWFDDSFVDLSSGGISKFYDGPLRPADLGPRGANPTGSIPKIYLGGDMTANTGGAVGAGAGGGWNAPTGANNGSATGFTVTGTVTNSTL